MSADLRLINRQRTRPLDLRRLRQVIRFFLGELSDLPDYDLCVQLVNATAMARLNQEHLGHEGSTDVITLDYADGRREESRTRTRTTKSPPSPRPSPPGRGRARRRSLEIPAVGGSGAVDKSICGEIFVCVDEAQAQARRFRVPWTVEVVRYVVHGVLHLRGHDDRTAKLRRRMKLVEVRLVSKLGRRFRLSALARKGRLKA